MNAGAGGREGRILSVKKNHIDVEGIIEKVQRTKMAVSHSVLGKND